MEVIFVAVVLCLVLYFLSQGGSKKEISAADRVKHRQDGDSHIYYYNQYDELVHESEGCSDCMADYAAQLKEKGVRVQEVVLGRRHSGDLEW